MRNELKRTLVWTALVLSGIITRIHAQGDVFTYAMNWNYDYNDCLWYNVYTTKTYGDSVIIDTANLCRVKRNRIRSVSVYRFANWEDTILFRHIVYDKNGFVVNWTPSGTTSTLKCHCCRSPDSIPQLNRRTVVRTEKAKRVWIRNESGYVTEYKFFNRGSLWNRFINAMDNNDHKIKYDYSEDGRTVTQNDIPKRYFSIFRRWTRDPDFRWVFVFDENANLISEHNYDLRGEEPVLYYSYIYKYEYYDAE